MGIDGHADQLVAPPLSPEQRSTCSDSRIMFLKVATPFAVAYLTFVAATPAEYFFSSSPVWRSVRIGIVIFWLWLMFLFKYGPKRRWRWDRFTTGFLSCGGVSAIIFFGSIVLGRADSRWGVWGSLGTYAMLSGLWGATSASIRSAIVQGVLFFALQLVVDAVLHVPWMVVP